MLVLLDSSGAAVIAILDRAGRMTADEAEVLDVTFRERPALPILAASVLEEHQIWLNTWAMFDHWAHPAAEMGEARRRVAEALGQPTDPYVPALERDDGSVRWGAASAVACAVLAVGRARYSTKLGGFGADPRLRAPWDTVVRDLPGSGRF